MPVPRVTLQGLICSPSNTACSMGLGTVDTVDIMTLVSVARLRNMAYMGALNVQAVDEAALTEVFLPHLLPTHWRGKAFVPAGQAAEGPQPAWFCLLWRKLKVNPFSTMSVASDPQAVILPFPCGSLNVSMPRYQPVQACSFDDLCTPSPVSCIAC